jgi:hypothetical protein
MNSQSICKLLMTLACSILCSAAGLAQTALVQFIHNSADPATGPISIHINEDVVLDSLPFHFAGAMVPVDTSTASIIRIYSANDTSLISPLLTDTLALVAGSKHICILNGILDTANYSPNPALRLDHLADARDLSTSGNGIDITFCHGSTDVDSIDVAESALFELTAFEGLQQGEFSDYLSIFNADYAFNIRNTLDSQDIGDFAAPFQSLNWGGKAITLLSGGFVNQTENNNGIAFGLWATTRDGGPLVCLQPNALQLNSPVQWINNTASGVSASVRITVNDQPWTNDLHVHAATGFDDFPAAQTAVITVHSNVLQGPLDSIWSDTVYLFSGQAYRALFFGAGTEELPFQLQFDPYSAATPIAGDSLMIDFFQGATCFEPLTIQADTLNQTGLFENVSYGQTSPGLTIAAVAEEWIARTDNDSLTTWQVPFGTTSFTGRQLTLITHTASECSALTAWLLGEDGGPLTQLETLYIPPPTVYAGIQFIHACGDTALEALDLYLNDSLYLSSFNFREASSFVQVPVNDSLRLAIVPPNAPATSTPLFEQTLHVAPNENYRFVLAGILSNQGYNPAPDLRWTILTAIPEPAPNACALQLFHAATDAGTMRIEESTTPIVPFFSALDFGEVSYANSLDANQDYALGVYNNDVNFQYGVYALPLNSWLWGDSIVTILASGFRQPLNNSGGVPFALHAITHDGTVIPLSNYVSTENTLQRSNVACYPNPASDNLTLELSAFAPDELTITLHDARGMVALQQQAFVGSEMRNITLDTSSMASGIYQLAILGKKTVIEREKYKTVMIQR